MTIKEVSEKYGITQATLRYYERVGMIPPVTRTTGNVRNYQESDLGWVELAKCLRNAGLTVEAMTEYVRLDQKGRQTIPDRHRLLVEQREILLKRREQIDQAMERLNHKIDGYEEGLRTGVLPWEKNER